MNTPPAYHRLLETPLGTLRLISDGKALSAIEFQHQHQNQAQNQAQNQSQSQTQGAIATNAEQLLDQAAKQLSEYFGGRRRLFELPLCATGTTFQHSVWQALQAIPYGEVRSYRDIAISLGKDNAVRAVGAANGRNPLPIIVPCHRVIGSNGSLTGFAGGLKAKKLLLELEGAL